MHGPPGQRKDLGKEEKPKVPKAIAKGGGKATRVAPRVPSPGNSPGPGVRLPTAPRNPAPRAKTSSHATEVSNAFATALASVTTPQSKNMNVREEMKEKVVKVMSGKDKEKRKVDTKNAVSSAVVQMSVETTSRDVIAAVSTPSVVTPVNVAHRRHLGRHTIAKHAWRFDRPSSVVAKLLKQEFKLSHSEESALSARISDMRIAFKFMTTRLRQCCNVAVGPSRCR